LLPLLRGVARRVRRPRSASENTGAMLAVSMDQAKLPVGKAPRPSSWRSLSRLSLVLDRLLPGVAALVCEGPPDPGAELRIAPLRTAPSREAPAPPQPTPRRSNQCRMRLHHELHAAATPHRSSRFARRLKAVGLRTLGSGTGQVCKTRQDPTAARAAAQACNGGCPWKRTTSPIDSPHAALQGSCRSVQSR